MMRLRLLGSPEPKGPGRAPERSGRRRPCTLPSRPHPGVVPPEAPAGGRAGPRGCPRWLGERAARGRHQGQLFRTPPPPPRPCPGLKSLSGSPSVGTGRCPPGQATLQHGLEHRPPLAPAAHLPAPAGGPGGPLRRVRALQPRRGRPLGGGQAARKLLQRPRQRILLSLPQ